MHSLIHKLYNSDKKILIIGDVMLDEYYFGDAERISPEAPVPVFSYKGQNVLLGGAANVAANLSINSQNVYVMAVVGDDKNGERIIELLEKRDINTMLIVKDKTRKTTVKTRLIAQNNQQLIRIDSEDRNDLSEEVELELISALKQCIDRFEIILISDYLKGLLTVNFTRNIISLANAHNIKVFADIKDKRIEKYKDAYLLKPNRKELEDLTGYTLKTDDDIIKAIQFLKAGTNAKCCLVTLGSRGMVFLDSRNDVYYENALAKQVYDVTGAGDTVLAYLGLCASNGFKDSDCIKVANIAAGIKVGKVGTSTVSLDEIYQYIQQQEHSMLESNGLLSIDDLSIIEKARKGKVVVFTNGCFDILHVGHIRYLKKAKEMGDILIVGLNTDESVRRLKGEKRPITNEDERAEMLSALRFVDFIVKFHQDTPYELIKRIKPDILIKGGDYSPDKVIGKDIVESYGGRVEIAELVNGKATTNVVQKILETYK